MEEVHQPGVCIPRDIQLKAAINRLDHLDKEINNGYKILGKHKKTVTIFGSARLTDENFYYQKAYELGNALAKKGFAVVTGGGNGIMEAANKGAFEAGGASIGFNIELPHEQVLNQYVNESYGFTHFAPRKIMMTLFAHAYVYFPGGFGTLDELTEILTLTQTHKTNKAPIILFDSDYWTDFDKFVKKHLLGSPYLISPGDEALYTIADNVEAIVKLAEDNKFYCEENDVYFQRITLSAGA